MHYNFSVTLCCCSDREFFFTKSLFASSIRTVASFLRSVARCRVTPGSRTSTRVNTCRRNFNKIFSSDVFVTCPILVERTAFFFRLKIKKWFGCRSEVREEMRASSDSSSNPFVSIFEEILDSRDSKNSII